MQDHEEAKLYSCTLNVLRAWPGVFDTTNKLIDNFFTLIRNAKEFIYLEHQYPFQNAALTQCMIETLQKNPKLKLIVITPVKTDLPSGVVGDLIDMSQDHSMKNFVYIIVIDHLQWIHKVAPDRVGVYGLVRQEEKSKTS